MSTSDNPELEAAKDYRAQQQKRFKTDENYRLRLEPDQLDAAVEFIKRQFPDTALPNLRQNILDKMVAQVAPEDDPLTHISLESEAREIEKVISGLGLSLRSGVTVGILHGDHLEAMQMPVMTTQASVIMMTRHLTTLIYRLAKLFARTVIMGPTHDGIIQMNWEAKPVMKSLMADIELRRDWGMFFLDYCRNPKTPDIGHPIKISGDHQIHLIGDIDEAMTWFVLAHEYSHHVLEHSWGGIAQAGGEASSISQTKETEADTLGTVICMLLGQNNPRGLNHCAETNVGAVLILSVLDFIKRGYQIMLTGDEEGFRKEQKHPPLADRLNTIANVTRQFIERHCSGDQEGLDAYLKQQTDVAELIDAIWKDNRSFLLHAYKIGERGVADQQDWLPI